MDDLGAEYTESPVVQTTKKWSPSGYSAFSSLIFDVSGPSAIF